MSPETIFINLKILSSLPPFARLNTCHELFQIEVDRTWSISWIWRFIRGDNRKEALKRIDMLIDHANELLPTCKEKNRLRKHLYDAKQGIRHLQDTYRHDYTTIASLDRILDKMPVHEQEETPIIRPLTPTEWTHNSKMRCKIYKTEG